MFSLFARVFVFEHHLQIKNSPSPWVNGNISGKTPQDRCLVKDFDSSGRKDELRSTNTNNSASWVILWACYYETQSKYQFCQLCAFSHGVKFCFFVVAGSIERCVASRPSEQEGRKEASLPLSLSLPLSFLFLFFFSPAPILKWDQRRLQLWRSSAEQKVQPWRISPGAEAICTLLEWWRACLLLPLIILFWDSFLFFFLMLFK